MAEYIVTDTELTALADKIRAKGGTEGGLAWLDGYMAAVDAIETEPPKVTAINYTALPDGAKALFNGVELPALPAWDTAAYPYACIVYVGTASNYWLYVMAAEPHIDAEKTTLLFDAAQSYMTNLLQEDGTWSSEWTQFNTANVCSLSACTPKWTNTDILHSDGTVYLAGSDPVPVSGTFTETLESGQTVNYTVTPGDSGRVSTITNGEYTTAVTWG